MFPLEYRLLATEEPCFWGCSKTLQPLFLKYGPVETTSAFCKKVPFYRCNGMSARFVQNGKGYGSCHSALKPTVVGPIVNVI